MFLYNKEKLNRMAVHFQGNCRIYLSVALIGFIVFTLNPTVLAQDKYAEFEVGWMRADDSTEKVVSIFGQPKSIQEKDASGPYGSGYIWRTYVYDDLSVTFLARNSGGSWLRSLSTTSTSLYTKSGIRIGDSLDRVKQTYQTGKVNYNSYTGKNYYTYHVFPQSLSFLIGGDGKVAEIRFGFTDAR